ncbi:MAG: DNA recombination protein RmuC [Actinobacteria bacterium]|nr:DNA recombination protein RmuC [Actinomycetota bacterium]
MTVALLGLIVMLVLVAVVLLVILVRRNKPDLAGLEPRFLQVLQAIERGDRVVREELGRSREEAAANARQVREEVAAGVKGLGDSVIRGVGELGAQQKAQFDTFATQLVSLTDTNEKRLGELRATVDDRLKQLQTENSQKLDEMRKTVDERLEATLEKRLGESFKQVSERLEAVHKGLGEMQVLAAGVGDLKKVLTNVKARGMWGEVQLGNLLEQILTSEQYEANVCCRPPSADRVEFAIRLPGPDGKKGESVYLPIDAKFPIEDYQRLTEAQENADMAGVELAGKQLEARIRLAAKDIQAKYINPPKTTDFGLMFLPTESLYAEVLRRPGLAEFLQRECRVVIAGPSTLAALLNSLQMGFKTLAIEKRSSEVWQLLGAVKTQFGQFGVILEKVHKKLDQASTTIEDAARKSRTIERKLRGVEELPEEAAAGLLPTGAAEVDD